MANTLYSSANKYPSEPTHADNGKPNTGAQILVDTWDGTMPRSPASSTMTFAKARQMRKHPSIAMARDYAIAPIVASEWAVEGENQQAVDYITEQVLPHRTKFLYPALYDEIDFGWSAWEVVFNADGSLNALKALLTELTWARRDIATGDYVGLKTIDRYSGMYFYLDPLHSLFVSHDPEGLGGYGTAKLANAEAAYDAWLVATDAAERFDLKRAGGILKIDYMPLRMPDKDGNEAEAFDIAKEASRQAKGGGTMIVPNQPVMIGEQAVKTFEVEFVDTSGGGADFTPRLKYLDALMFRSVIVPERVLAEGSFGTKAESEAQASVALLCMQLKAEQLVECLNHYLVDRLLMIRFGETGTAKLCAQPLDDEEKAFHQKVLTTALADATVAPELMSRIDWDAELDRCDITTLETPDPAMEQAQAEQLQAKADAAAVAPQQEQK